MIRSMLKSLINPKKILKNSLDDYFKQISKEKKENNTVLKFFLSVEENHEGKDIKIITNINNKDVNTVFLSTYVNGFNIDDFSFSDLGNIIPEGDSEVIEQSLGAFGINKDYLKKETENLNPDTLLNPFFEFFDELEKEHQQENVFFVLSIKQGKKIVSTAYTDLEHKTKYIKHQTLNKFIKELSF